MENQASTSSMSEIGSNPFEPIFDEIRRIVREEIARVGANGASELLTPEQLAKALKVSPTWVYEQSRLGNLPTHRIGRYIRFDLNEVIIEEQKKNQKTP